MLWGIWKPTSFQSLWIVRMPKHEFFHRQNININLANAVHGLARFGHLDTGLMSAIADAAVDVITSFTAQHLVSPKYMAC